MSSNDFEQKCGRSVRLDDLGIIQSFAQHIASLENLPSGYVVDGSLTVASDGYVIGEVWWNPMSEIWIVDPSRYGEPA